MRRGELAFPCMTPQKRAVAAYFSSETDGTLTLPYFVGSRSYTCQPDNTQRFATSGLSTVPAIFIRWRQQDLIYLQTHPLLPGVTPWTPSTLSSTQSSSSSAPSGTQAVDGNGNASPKRGLPKGGVAGIAIMCLVLGLVIGAVALLLLRRRRRHHQAVDSSQPREAAASFTDTKPQLIGQTAVENEQRPHHLASLAHVNIDRSYPTDAAMSGIYESPTTEHRTSGYTFGVGSVTNPDVPEVEARELQPVLAELHSYNPAQGGELANPDVPEVEARELQPALAELHSYNLAQGGELANPDVPEVEARELQPVLAELHSNNPSQGGEAGAAGSSYSQPMYTTGQMRASMSQGGLSSTDSNAGVVSSGNLSPSQEMEMLAQQQSQLRAKRETLLKLHEIEENQRRIEARMQELRQS